MTSCRTIIASLAVAGAAVSATAQVEGGGLVLELEPVAGDFARPLAAVDSGDGSGRLFVVEQAGLIWIWNGSSLLSEPFLDLSTAVDCCGERGLLGLAFHPDYATNGYFFVSYTDLGADTVISRFGVSMNPDVADPGSELVLITQAQPASNHNNGNLAFGPDGYLYVGMGDGGPGGDPDDRGQDLGSLLGKILRIDVDNPDPPLPYGVPEDNPFVDEPTALKEIWSYGLRNPWRFSFDRETGDLFIGDVGQGALEEIDFQPAADPGGANYGWRLMEGSSCFDPPTNCDDGSLTLPVLEYDHGFGCAVTGGFRYRGVASPRLRGVYLYGDYCEGTVWGTVPGCDGVWESRPLLESGLQISSFGEDSAGEVYIVSLSGTDGEVLRVELGAASGGPMLIPTPGSLDFGTVEVGAGVTLPLSLLNGNAGPEALTIDALAFSDPTQFSVDTTAGATPCGPEPICLGPGESCTLEVTLVPTVEGALVDSLDFAGNIDPSRVGLEALTYIACPHPVTLPVSGEAIDDLQIFEACAEVIVGPDVTVLAGGEAVFQAGARVTLGEDLSVVPGATLRVEVDPLLSAGASPP